MTDENQEITGGDFLHGLESAKDTPIAPAHGIAAIALNMAMKYHDMNMIRDGALYQQYKLEGRNIGSLNLDVVFETAIRIEMHLLGASDRIAKIVVEALEFKIDEDDPEKGETGPDTDPA